MKFDEVTGTIQLYPSERETLCLDEPPENYLSGIWPLGDVLGLADRITRARELNEAIDLSAIPQGPARRRVEYSQEQSRHRLSFMLTEIGIYLGPQLADEAEAHLNDQS